MSGDHYAHRTDPGWVEEKKRSDGSSDSTYDRDSGSKHPHESIMEDNGLAEAGKFLSEGGFEVISGEDYGQDVYEEEGSREVEY